MNALIPRSTRSLTVVFIFVKISSAKVLNLSAEFFIKFFIDVPISSKNVLNFLNHLLLIAFSNASLIGLKSLSSKKFFNFFTLSDIPLNIFLKNFLILLNTFLIDLPIALKTLNILFPIALTNPKALFNIALNNLLPNTLGLSTNAVPSAASPANVGRSGGNPNPPPAFLSYFPGPILFCSTTSGSLVAIKVDGLIFALSNNIDANFMTPFFNTSLFSLRAEDCPNNVFAFIFLLTEFIDIILQY